MTTDSTVHLISRLSYAVGLIEGMAWHLGEDRPPLDDRQRASAVTTMKVVMAMLNEAIDMLRATRTDYRGQTVDLHS